MLYNIHYFKKSNDGICAADFDNRPQMVTINTEFILSLSDLLEFNTPLSGKFVSNFAILTMSNNDKYYINETMLNVLIEQLPIFGEFILQNKK